MQILLPPEAWRSEAFAEDLSGDADEAPPLPKPPRETVAQALGGLFRSARQHRRDDGVAGPGPMTGGLSRS